MVLCDLWTIKNLHHWSDSHPKEPRRSMYGKPSFGLIAYPLETLYIISYMDVVGKKHHPPASPIKKSSWFQPTWNDYSNFASCLSGKTSPTNKSLIFHHLKKKNSEANYAVSLLDTSAAKIKNGSLRSLQSWLFNRDPCFTIIPT